MSLTGWCSLLWWLIMQAEEASVCHSKVAGEISVSPRTFVKVFSSSAFWNPSGVGRWLQGREILRICEFSGPQELLWARALCSFSHMLFQSCVGTAGKVWEGENLRFGICFSEKPFNCQWQKTWCKQTWAKRKLTLLSKVSSGGPAFHGVWSELKLMPQGLASLWLGLVFLCIWALFFNFVVAKKGQQLHLSSSSYMPHGEHCLFLF